MAAYSLDIRNDRLNMQTQLIRKLLSLKGKMMQNPICSGHCTRTLFNKAFFFSRLFCSILVLSLNVVGML